MRESNEFYDVKISQDIISEKDRNIIMNSLIKNEEKNINDDKLNDRNMCFLFLALLLISTVISIAIYVCIIFC
jgi:hypothetical protein